MINCYVSAVYLLSCFFAAALLVASYITGVPIMIEAYVPKQIPRMRATERPLIDSPPKIAIASITMRVDTEVLTVRVRVLLRASTEEKSSAVI